MELRTIHNVLVIGAGTMGWQIALLFAQHRYTVCLSDAYDTVLQRAQQTIEDNLGRRVAKGKISEAKRDEIVQRLSYVGNWEEIAPAQDLVLEAVPEKLDLKRELFGKMATLVTPGTICATNSSTIGIPKIVEGLPPEFADYTCNIHFCNPVFRMLMVELYCNNQDPEFLGHLKRVFRSMRYEVVVLKHLINGFVMNRILGGALMELFHLVENDIASLEDIDIACTVGLGWPLGIARLADYIGLDTVYNSFQTNYEDSQIEAYRPPQFLAEMVQRGELGMKTKKGLYTYTKPEPEE